MNEMNPRTIGMVTQEINQLTAQAQRLILGHAIEIGRRLTEAKQMLSHGEWGKWLKEEIHYSKSSANNMMRIFDAYGSTQMGLFGPEANSQTFGDLEYSKALALLSVPAEEREQFAQEVDAEHISVRQLKAAIQERDAAQKQAAEVAAEWELAKEALREKEKAIQLANQRLEASASEADSLRKENEQLRQRPVDVAVEQVDATQEQLRAAEQRGRNAAKKALQEKLSQAQAQADAANQAADQLRATLEKAQGNQILLEINVLFRQMQEQTNAIRAMLEKLDDVTKRRTQEALGAFFRQLSDVVARQTKEGVK